MFKFKKQLLEKIILLSIVGAAVCFFGATSINIFSSAPPIVKIPSITLPAPGPTPTPTPSPHAVLKSYLEGEIAQIQANPATSKFSFAVLSDSHVSPDNGSNSTTLQNILEDIDAGNYLFAIGVGDLVIGTNSDNEHPYFYDIIKNRKTPILTAAGNHDVERDNGKDYLNVLGELYYSFDYGTSLFIVFNDSDNKFIDDEQLLWLEQQLSRDYENKFVFMHKPLSDPRENVYHALTNKKLISSISSLLEEYKTDNVFSGHIHAYYEWEVNGVKYTTTGGAGGSPVGNDPQHNFHNYIRVDVDGNEISKQAIKIP